MIKVAILCFSKSNAVFAEIAKLYFSTIKSVSFVHSSSLKEVIKLAKEYQNKNVPIIVLSKDIFPSINKIIEDDNYSTALVSPGNYDDIIDYFIKDPKLKSFSLLAYQGYRLNPKYLSVLKEKYFEDMRLGLIRENIKNCEPLLRNAEYVFFDSRSIRYSDFPYSCEANPNGLYAEEACTIAGYVGWSEQLKGVFIYGYDLDSCSVTVCNKLFAELVWHISEGVFVSAKENPFIEFDNDFIRKIVSMGDQGQDLIFIYSNNTSRWWMEIPTNDNENYVYVPCSSSDYESACAGDVPLRWLFFYTKYALL